MSFSASLLNKSFLVENMTWTYWMSNMVLRDFMASKNTILRPYSVFWLTHKLLYKGCCCYQHIFCWISSITKHVASERHKKSRVLWCSRASPPTPICKLVFDLLSIMWKVEFWFVLFITKYPGFSRSQKDYFQQGWTPRPAGRGGFPAPPRTVGRGGLPAPTRPVKMIKTAGKLRGKIKAQISNFSNRGNQYDGTILQQWTMPNPACQ